jgi:gluconokinase
MGVSGCGKTAVGSALADRLGGVFVDADDHHPPANRAKMAAGRPLDDADRAPWLAELRRLIEQTLNDPAAPPMVLACSALKRAYRDVLDPTLRGPSGQARSPVEPPAPRGERAIRFVFLDADRDTLAARLAARADHFFNPTLLDSQLDTLERPSRVDAIVIHVPGKSVESIVALVGLELIN